MSYRAQPLQLQDSHELSESLKAHHSEYFSWELAEILGDIQKIQSLCLKAEKTGELLCWVTYDLLQDSKTIEVRALATHPKYLKQGFMEQLFRELSKKESQALEIWLEVHENNQTARNLYAKLGFQQTAQRPRYYKDGGAAVLMSLNPLHALRNSVT